MITSCVGTDILSSELKTKISSLEKELHQSIHRDTLIHSTLSDSLRDYDTGEISLDELMQLIRKLPQTMKVVNRRRIRSLGIVDFTELVDGLPCMGKSIVKIEEVEVQLDEGRVEEPLVDGSQPRSGSGPSLGSSLGSGEVGMEDPNVVPNGPSTNN